MLSFKNWTVILRLGKTNTLSTFLESLAAWLGDADGYYAALSRTVPNQPTWELFAQSLLAARSYE